VLVDAPQPAIRIEHVQRLACTELRRRRTLEHARTRGLAIPGESRIRRIVEEIGHVREKARRRVLKGTPPRLDLDTVETMRTRVLETRHETLEVVE
jgi:hypothetical protein